MFYLIPAPLHRLALRVGYRLRAKWRRQFRRPTFGVSFIARDGEGRVLLVRHTYGSGNWSLPGGGRPQREDPIDCVRREIREELGCELVDLELARVSHSEIQGAPNTGHIYTGFLGGEPVPDGREILAVEWFDPAHLPRDTVRIARRQIEHVVGRRD